MSANKWMHFGQWCVRLQDGSIVEMNTEKAADLLLRLDREVGGPDDPDPPQERPTPTRVVDPEAKARRKTTRAR